MTTTIATLIRARRIAAGMTQNALARRVGCADVHVSRWEAGRFCPSARYAAKLAEALGGSPLEYLGIDRPEMGAE